MKRNCNVFLVLLVTVFVFSSFASVYRILPTARATYVEGAITQDTDWTLVDSPFTVSNNITVNPGATLTIEPGVQVRFADNFSMMVNGRIIADGTNDRMILFTSNSLNASDGKWGTIIINGAQQSSITNCIIEYGTTGTTLRSGSINFRNNIVRSNQNGIMANSGSATIENNEITNNTLSGINIAGGSQVTVQNNNISSDEDGIVLTGNLAGNINIAQNNIFQNNGTGILLGANGYFNTIIVQNNVSMNGYGFHVTTSAGTYITSNYISNNTNGIFYETGKSHEAHFNDIYNNTMGMDVSALVDSNENCVNATHNYWGDESGPAHSSLNPYGKGNPVGGNGVTVDFIFFLSKPIDYSNVAPTAILQTDKTLAAPNQNVTFIGTNSYDDGRVDQYLYDFGDGANSGWTTLTLFNHTYSTVGTYTASLKVIDDFDRTSQNTATTIINVQNLTPLNVALGLSSQVADYNGNVTITVYVSNALGGVQNAAVTLLALKSGSFSPVSGLTDQTGYFSTTFTAPNVTDLSYVRLIATASEAGYADGSGYEYLKVLSMLHTQIRTIPVTVKSEATVAAILQVTNGLGQPVSNASVTATVDNGALSAGSGATGTNGNLTLSFLAPYTLSPVNVTFTMTAQQAGYTDGYDQETVTVFQNVLDVKLTPSLATMPSEGNTTVTALVTCDTNPVPNANVTVSSGSTGNFISTAGITDSNGMVTFLFTAPLTTSTLSASITATATKSHYIDGTNHTDITIVPKVLIVSLTADNYTTISESNVSVAVRVTYNLAPVQNVNVTVTSGNGGNFSPPDGTTDAYGFAYFIFTAPQANAPTYIVITAQCSKTGYADGQNSLTLTDNIGNMSVQVTASSYAIMPSGNAVLTVKASADSRPVAGAQVTISSNATGNFSSATGLTDVNGTCSFVYNAPSTTVQLTVAISANVSKNGYLANANQTTISVIPVAPTHNEGGFPWLTMLLIIIPVAIAVIVLVLIKLKVIVVSAGEEESTAE